MKWHVCRLKLSCHSNNLIKAPLLGALTCIPTVGKMSFIMGLNSVKSQSTVDLQKSEIANLRNSQRSTNMNTIPNGCEKFGFCLCHLPFPETTTSISVFQAYNFQVIGDSSFPLITPLTRAQDVALLFLFYYPYRQGITISSAHPNFLQLSQPTTNTAAGSAPFPYSAILKALFGVHPSPKNSHKTGIQMNISILRKKQLPMSRAASIRYLSRL